MKRKKYHHNDLKRHILDISIKIISKEGIDKLSIRHVASKLGVSHTAPYRHFKNKEELIVAIAEQGFEILTNSLDNAIAQYPDDYKTQLKQAGKAYISFAKMNPDYYRVMFSDYIKNKIDYPAFMQAYDKSFKKIVSLLENCITDRSVDIRITALAAWSLMHGYSSFIIDNKLDNLVGSEGQINMIVKKLVELV